MTTQTPEERRELVERPFFIQTIGAQRSWGGTGTSNWLKEGRNRAYTYQPVGGNRWLKIAEASDI